MTEAPDPGLVEGAASSAAKTDLLTIAAVGALAYIVQDFTHELLGHGVGSWLFGAHPYRVSAIYLLYHGDLPAGASRWVASAGSLVNFLEALICWLVLRCGGLRNPYWRFFLWTSLVLDLFAEGCYMALCPVFGDWSVVKRDDGSSQWAYKGKPVYTYAKDTAGKATGDGVGGVWHLVAE